MTEAFTERTAGIWLPCIVYMTGGVYMLAMWGIFDRTAIHLVALGTSSLILALALFLMSRWAYWLGLFTFPLYLVEFLYALMTSVKIVGWSPNLPSTLFHASILAYLIFLILSLILLIDKRNQLRSDQIIDRIRKTLTAPATSSKPST